MLCSSPVRSLLHWHFSSFRCRLSSDSRPLASATSSRLRCNSAMVRSLAPAALANSSPRRAAFCWLEAASSWTPRSCSFRDSSSASKEDERSDPSGKPVSSGLCWSLQPPVPFSAHPHSSRLLGTFPASHHLQAFTHHFLLGLAQGVLHVGQLVLQSLDLSTLLFLPVLGLL